MLIAASLSKSYPTPRGDLPILRDVSFCRRAWRCRRHHGSVRQRQEHAAVHPRRARARSTSGHVTLDGSDPYRLGGARAGGVSQPADRLRLPGSLASAAVLGARERARADPGRSAVRSGIRTEDESRAPRAAHPGRPRRSARSPPGGAVRRREAARRAGARADPQSGAAALRRAHRQPRSRRPQTPSPRCSSICTHARQTILVVVTHSAALAERFPRRYEMNEGTLSVTRLTLVIRSLTFHWRTNLAVLLGVAAAIRGAGGRAGRRRLGAGQPARSRASAARARRDRVVSTATSFRAGRRRRLCEEHSRCGIRRAAVIANGFVTHEPSRRRAPNVLVYGVDAALLVVPRASRRRTASISRRHSPPSSAFNQATRCSRACRSRRRSRSSRSSVGRRTSAGRCGSRLTGVLPRERLGEFALQPQQAEVRAIFAPLARLQRDLGVPGHVNTVLLAGVSNSGRRPGRCAPPGGPGRPGDDRRGA